MRRPNTFALRTVSQDCLPHVLLLGALYAARAAARALRRGDAWGLFAVAYAAGYLLLVSWSTIPQPRYALPVIVLLHGFCAMALLCPATARPDRRAQRVALFGLGCALVLFVQAPRTVDFLLQFRDDARFRLLAWVQRNVPPGTRILQDQYAGLQEISTGAALTRAGAAVEVITSRSASDRGNLDRIRAQGVRYVAVSDTAYGRFFDPLVIPTPAKRAAYAAHRAFFEELFAKEQLVWHSEPAHPTRAYTNPSLRLYRLRDATGTRKDTPHEDEAGED